MTDESVSNAPATIQVTNYNLSFVLTGGKSLVAAVMDFGDADEQFRFVPNKEGVEVYQRDSPLVVAAYPPRLTVLDTSGDWPLSAEMATLTIAFRRHLLEKRIRVIARGWNVEVNLGGFNNANLMDRAFDIDSVEWILGGEIEPSWFVDEVRFFTTSPFSEETSVTIQPRPDRTARLHINAQLETLVPDAESELVKEGYEFRQVAQAIVSRVAEDRTR